MVPTSLTVLALPLTRLLQRFLRGDFRRPEHPPENIEIHAVIVSAAQSPWDAIKRAPGVGTITVVGGIVALGKTPIPGEIPGGGPQPDWLRLIPGCPAFERFDDSAGCTQHHGYSLAELPD